jgi:hypothetical protein
MIIENKYVVVINNSGDCIINSYFKAVNIETKSNIIIANKLSEIDIKLLPILEDLKDAEINKIYNYNREVICNKEII